MEKVGIIGGAVNIVIIFGFVFMIHDNSYCKKRNNWIFHIPVFLFIPAKDTQLVKGKFSTYLNQF